MLSLPNQFPFPQGQGEFQAAANNQQMPLDRRRPFSSISQPMIPAEVTQTAMADILTLVGQRSESSTSIVTREVKRVRPEGSNYNIQQRSPSDSIKVDLVGTNMLVAGKENHLDIAMHHVGPSTIPKAVVRTLEERLKSDPELYLTHINCNLEKLVSLFQNYFYFLDTFNGHAARNELIAALDTIQHYWVYHKHTFANDSELQSELAKSLGRIFAVAGWCMRYNFKVGQQSTEFNKISGSVKQCYDRLSDNNLTQRNIFIITLLQATLEDSSIEPALQEQVGRVIAFLEDVKGLIYT